MTDKSNPRFTQDGLTVAHLGKSLSVAHIAQGLGSIPSQGGSSGSAPPATSPVPNAETAPAPAATGQKP